MLISKPVTGNAPRVIRVYQTDVEVMQELSDEAMDPDLMWHFIRTFSRILEPKFP